MIDSLNTYTSTNTTYSQGQSFYQAFFEKFSALLTEEQEVQSSQKQELSAEEGSIDNPIQITKASEPASAYLSQTSSWSLETHGSHKVNGVELVPGAPEYNAALASTYHQEIAISNAQRATDNTNRAIDLASALQSLDLPQTKTNTSATQTTSSTNPPSAYVATNTLWSLETHGSHIVNGIQLIPGAPGYNTALASPYHQEIAQTNARLNQM